MDSVVAPPANRDQVLVAVFASTAAERKVMYFNCRHGPTDLAPPAIPFENLTAQFLILLGI
jgi:hypothetical protein